QAAVGPEPEPPLPPRAGASLPHRSVPDHDDPRPVAFASQRTTERPPRAPREVAHRMDRHPLSLCDLFVGQAVDRPKDENVPVPRPKRGERARDHAVESLTLDTGECFLRGRVVTAFDRMHNVTFERGA